MKFQIPWLLSFLMWVAVSSSTCAQQYVWNGSATCSVNGVLQSLPWSGGFNAPQFSTIDANLDGKKDLFVFDRQGSRVSIFINTSSTVGEIAYAYATQYNSAFPPVLKNWVLLRDMNCDGKEDVCTNSGSGFKIYWNTSTTSLSFDWTITPNVPAFYDWGGSSTNSTVFSIAPDVPGMEDYDNDGDMDFWSWNEFSTALFFYQNRGVENGDCLPDFECRNRCYGMFGESSESFALSLGDAFSCDFNVADPRSAEQRHTGGTTLPIDLDQNGLLDLVIGDVTANSMTAVLLEDAINGQDSAVVESLLFPAGFGAVSGVDLVTFLAGFYVDVNNDGIRDLIVAPNANGDAEDRSGVWLYLNSGMNDAPIFILATQHFLQGDMLDVGTSSYPELADVDGDGRTDLVVGNRKYYLNGSPQATSLAFYRNTGS
ncbi:MAG: FG-GAP repeat domain-containing protein, partial [Flavobacteriales bacterium]